METTISFSVRGVVLVGAIAIGMLALGDLAGVASSAVFGRDHLMGLVPLFALGNEQNVPTWYSSAALGSAGLLLAAIGVSERGRGARFAIHWLVLAGIFFLLSCDETATIHELSVAPTSRIIESQFLRYISWVVPAAVLVAVVGIAYLRFFVALPGRFRRLFGAAGALYVGGSLGMELITGAFGRRVMSGRLHFLFNLSEEVLELAGVLLLIYALLTYLKDQCGDLRIRLT